MPGTEYLVSDPYDVPGLRILLENCTRPGREIQELVFPARSSKNASDTFSKLPREVLFTIVPLLASRDVVLIDVHRIDVVSPLGSAWRRNRLRALRSPDVDL